MRIAALALLFAALLPLAGCLSSGLPTIGEVPPFELTGEEGQPFRSAEQVASKVWVANFIFTTCNGPCPRMSTQMKRVQEATREFADVHLVSFSIDPKNDTPEVLAAYAKRYKADPKRWHFLTGTREDLHHMSYDVFRFGSVDEKLEHSSRFVLVDSKSRIRGYYDTSDTNAVPQLIEDIAKVRKEVL